MSAVRRFVVASVLVLATLLPVTGAIWLDTTSSAANTFSAAPVFGTPAIRVVAYQVGPGAFTGTTFALGLDQALASDYFVILRGAAGTGGSGGNRGPDENFARVSGDPHGNFALVTASNQLQLERRGTDGDWQGQVVVVESVDQATTAGFRLVDVVEATLGNGVTALTAPVGGSWSSIGQVGVYGGEYGGGVDATATNTASHPVGWARIVPSGVGDLTFSRQSTGGNSLAGTARFTTYVVEWGTEWQIQRVMVAGSNGGDGVNAAGHYDVAGITPVERANSFILAFGHTASNRVGSGWDAQVFSLGDGVAQNATESQVAVGGEYASARVAEVYVHTHAQLRVDWSFGADGTTGIPATAATGTAAVAAPNSPEIYTSAAVSAAGERRLAIVSNSSDGNGFQYPNPMVWARHTDPTTVTWTRSRTGLPGAFWLQSVDFALVGS